MNRLIFCDIDGTIIDGSRGMIDVSIKTKYAFEQLKANGDYVIISSGRNKFLLSDEIKQTKPSGYILCNGAYGEFNNQMIYSYHFDDKALEAIIDIPSQSSGFYMLESLDNVYIRSLKDESFINFMNQWGMMPDCYIESSSLNGNYHVAMIGFLENENIKKIIDNLNKYTEVIPHNNTFSFDINVKNISKGTGVIKMREYLDIPIEDTYCFGDGLNDLDMLKNVGHPIIMANAHKDLNNYNFEVTDDVIDDGFYNYLVNNKLIKAL